MSVNLLVNSSAISGVTSTGKLRSAEEIGMKIDVSGDDLAPALLLRRNQCARRLPHGDARNLNDRWSEKGPIQETGLLRRKKRGGRVLQEKTDSVQLKKNNKVINVVMETHRKARTSLNRNNVVILKRSTMNRRVRPQEAKDAGLKKRARKPNRSTKKLRTKTNRKNLISNHVPKPPPNRTTAVTSSNSKTTRDSSSSNREEAEGAGVATSRAETDRDRGAPRKEEDD